MVLVKIKRKGRRVLRGGRKIGEAPTVEGKVVAADPDHHRYKVQFLEGDQKDHWVPVQDMTSQTREEERTRQIAAKGIYVFFNVWSDYREALLFKCCSFACL